MAGLLLLLLRFTLNLSHGSTLTLEQYLEQIREQNDSVRSSEIRSVGATLRASEGLHVYATRFFTDAQQLIDQRQTNNPNIQGNKTTAQAFSFGFQQPTPVGLTAKLYYSLIHTEISGASKVFLPKPEFYDARPTIELSQSLWNNAFGAATRASVGLSEALANASSFQESFKMKQELLVAEQTYWRLVLARQLILVHEKTLERAQKIRDWNERRVKLALADRADLLQADAAFQLRKMELQSALDEERVVAGMLNFLRGIESHHVDENLAQFDPKEVLNMQAPQRTDKRDDVKAAENNLGATMANSVIARHNTYPTLDVYGTYSRTARETERNDAFKNSFKPDYPMWSAGIRLNAPLDFFTTSKIRDGWEMERQGAELAYARKFKEQELEWNDLVLKLDEVKRKLQLALTIEEAQKEKLTHEKSRLDRGRTTTYQMLLFEQDYATAQQQRLQLQTQAVQIIAQMKVYK